MSKIIELKERIKRECFEEVSEMLDDVKSYDIEVRVRPIDIKIILNEMYNLYESKNIVYEYKEDMSDYFNETMLMAIDENKTINREFLINSLSTCQFIKTPVEIDRKDMSKTLIKTTKKLQKIGEL